MALRANWPSSKGFPVWGAWGAALVLAACAGRDLPPVGAAPPPIVTRDGLHLVDRDGPGTLLVRPSHGVGPETQYLLGDVFIYLAEASSQLTDRDVEKISHYFLDSTRKMLVQGKVPMAKEPGPGVVRLDFELVDFMLTKPKTRSGASTYITKAGAVTLVTELRDAENEQALLRYSARERFKGGIQLGSDHASWTKMKATFDRLLKEQRAVFREVLYAEGER